MPRAGWAAAGAVGAALAAELLPAAALVFASLALLGALAGAYAARHPQAVATSVGALLVLARVLAAAILAPPSAAPDHVPGSGLFEGSVVAVSSPVEGTQRAIVEARPVSETDTGRPSPAIRIYATLPRYPPVGTGDGVRFRSVLRAPPADEGFGRYLERNGVVATARVSEFEPAAGGAAVDQLERVRRALGDALAQVLPSPQAGLAAGILVGLRDRVDRDVADAFTASGLSHIVAISGWNIALVAGMVASLLRRIPRRPRSVLVVLAIAGYTLLAGASASVVRAALMAAVVLLGRETGRRSAAPSALGWAVVLMLAADPAAVSDAGFRLSVAATAGLLLWASALTARLAAALPERAPGWLAESLAISLAAQLATLPIVLLDFGRLSLVAPLANLLVAPLVAPAMLAGLVALVAGWAGVWGVPDVLVALSAMPGSVVLGAIIAIGRWSASLPLATVELPLPVRPAVALLAVACVGWLVARRTRGAAAAAGPPDPRVRAPVDRRPAPRAEADPGRVASRLASLGASGPLGRASAALLLSAGCLLVLVAASRPDGRLRLTVLDVGQGDAILVEGDRGARLLVDAGPDPDRLLTLLDARLPVWDRRLDLVVLTHPHEDHVAGLALLLERYRVGQVAEPGMTGHGPGYHAYAAELAERGGESRRLAAGDSFRLDGATVLVHWPLRGTVPRQPPDDGSGMNNVSIVLDLRYGERRFLLTGDIEQTVDPALLASGLRSSPGGRLDVLKVAHHGSGTATTDAFIEALRPRLAVVSVGARNRYGHPSPRTIARLEARGARVLRTDRDGSVTVTSDGRMVEAKTSGARVSRGRRPVGTPWGDVPEPRIPPWPSPTVTRPRPSSRRSTRRTGSSLTSRPLRTSLPGWPAPRRAEGRPSRSVSSRSPPSCTTSTSCCRAMTRSSSWGTGGQAHAGSPSAATASWPAPSRIIPSVASATTATTSAGGERLRSRN